MAEELYRRCDHCQRPVLQAARFCPYCGSRLGSVEEARAQVSVRDWNWVSWPKMVMAVLVTLAFVSVAGVCYSTLSGLWFLTSCFCPGGLTSPESHKDFAAFLGLAGAIVALLWVYAMFSIFQEGE